MDASFTPFEPLSELEVTQNPALGAFLIWKFGIEFQNLEGHAAPFHIAFLVLPLLLHQPTLQTITTTQKRSGLPLFCAKLNDRREEALAVHERSAILRSLSFQSIAMGIAHGLLSLNHSTATLRANTVEGSPKKYISGEKVKALANGAEKLGYWLSKQSLPQAAMLLQVDF